MEDGPEPPFLVDKQISLLPGVIFDKAPSGTKFGDCVDQPAASVQPSQTVTATFVIEFYFIHSDQKPSWFYELAGIISGSN